ncbi:MAG: hypothetical protein D6772_00430, partial [Bacteroidetes bacterium]
TYTGTATAAANYTWNFNGGIATPATGAGPHTVSWATAGSKTVSLTVSENGCTSTSATQMVMVEGPLAAPTINCSPTTSSITFTWAAVAGAVDYQASMVSGPASAVGSLDATARTYTVTGLQAGETVEIEVIAVGNGPCGNSSNTFSCAAENCPMVSISIDSIAPLCFATDLADIDLNITRSGGAGGGTETWSGNGIIDAATGLFSPTTAGVGSAVVNVSYREGNCSYTATRTIVINAVPTATFTASSPICITGTSDVLYTGSAGTGATFTWGFDGGTSNTGGSDGQPQMVSWPTPGAKTISLTVSENGCTSTAFTQTVSVEPSMIEPLVNCAFQSDSIVFSWPPDPNSGGYQVNVQDAPAGAMAVPAPPGFFIMSGVNPGESITIEVINTSSNSCAPASTVATCMAEACPPATIAIAEVSPICLDAAATTITLEAVVTGGTATGMVTWTGRGITDAAAGIFDPNQSGPGMHLITVTYADGPCSVSASRMLVVNAPPTANFTVDGPICEDAMTTVNYTGSAASTANYNWDFDGATIIAGNQAGPYTLSWPTGGARSLSLVVTENDCASEPFATTVMVMDSLMAPLISCDSDNTSITFSWNAVAGATTYTVGVTDAPSGITETPDLANRTYNIGNLSPGDEVTIFVRVESDNVCGPVQAFQTCTAQQCEDLFFGRDTYGPFCADAAPQTLVPVITQATPGGI